MADRQIVFPPKRVTVQIASGASVSDAWSTPESCNVMTLIIPVSLDAGSFWRLQTLVPDGLGADGKTQSWVETYVHTSAASPGALTQLGDGVAQFTQLVGAFTFPYNQFGTNPIRVKTAVNQTALRQLYITYDRA